MFSRNYTRLQRGLWPHQIVKTRQCWWNCCTRLCSVVRLTRTTCYVTFQYKNIPTTQSCGLDSGQMRTVDRGSSRGFYLFSRKNSLSTLLQRVKYSVLVTYQQRPPPPIYLKCTYRRTKNGCGHPISCRAWNSRIPISSTPLRWHDGSERLAWLTLD